jgi:hypothetical protein
LLFPELEERLRDSRNSLFRATCETVITRSEKYLKLLTDYRTELFALQKLLRTNQESGVEPAKFPDRKLVRQALETTTAERNSTEALLRSLTMISGYQAVETLNKHDYKGHKDWELGAGGVNFPGGSDQELIPVHTAVELCSLLLRGEYVNQNSQRAIIDS